MSQQRKTTRPATGFTLIEIMLALGVLGVGMVMIALIFPAAIHQTKQADRNTSAMLICGNARTVITMSVTHSVANPIINGSSEFVEVPLGNDLDPVNSYMVYDSDAWYPQPNREYYEPDYGAWPPNPNHSPDTYIDNTYGWVALVRQMVAGGNDYQFVVIPYAKFPGVDYSLGLMNAGDELLEGFPGLRNRPVLVHLAANVFVEQDPNDNGCRLRFDDTPFPDLGFLAIGSPVILDGANPADRLVAGRFPTIVGIAPHPTGNGMIATLSGNLLDPSPVQVTVLRGVWLMRGVAEGADSPAIGASSFRVKLAP